MRFEVLYFGHDVVVSGSGPFVAGPSGMQAQANEDGPSAPDLQLDWLSSSSDSDDTDDDSGIEVVSVKYQQQSAQKVSWCELLGEKCVGISQHRR